jgi:alpha-L-fucosidase
MPNFVGTEQANPDLSVDTFAPTGLDIDNWLDAIQAAGCTYATLTVKHHDGFCLWPTAYYVAGHDPYSIAETTWYSNNGSPDVVGLFVSKCNTRGISPNLYFSMWDTTYETRSGTDETTDAAAYIAMIQAQLTELLTNYGTIDSIWLDGWSWHLGHTKIPTDVIYHTIKGLSPSTLIIENSHDHPTLFSEIELYETPYIPDGPVPDGNTRLCEEVDTIRADTKWWDVTDNFRTASVIKAAIAHANANSATYLLGVIPGTDGHLSAAQVTRLAEIGA